MAFATHVSIDLKDFVLNNLQLGFSVSHVITKHHINV